MWSCRVIHKNKNKERTKMLRNKKLLGVAFLATLFVGSGTLLVGESYADDPVVPEGLSVL